MSGNRKTDFIPRHQEIPVKSYVTREIPEIYAILETLAMIITISMVSIRKITMIGPGIIIPRLGVILECKFLYY